MPERPVLPKGQEYGERQRLEQAQSAQPVAGAPQVPQFAPEPGGVPGLADPTAFSDQPLQEGLRGGPGMGPEALSMGTQEPQELVVLKQLARRYKFDSLHRLIMWAEQNMAGPVPTPDANAFAQAPPELEELFTEEDLDEDEMSDTYADMEAAMSADEVYQPPASPTDQGSTSQPTTQSSSEGENNG